MGEMAYEFYNAHRGAYKGWKHRDPVKNQIGKGGEICIKCKDDMWWYYWCDSGRVVW